MGEIARPLSPPAGYTHSDGRTAPRRHRRCRVGGFPGFRGEQERLQTRRLSVLMGGVEDRDWDDCVCHSVHIPSFSSVIIPVGPDS